MLECGQAIKRWIIGEFKQSPMGETVDVRNNWKGDVPDKRAVKIACPKCGNFLEREGYYGG